MVNPLLIFSKCSLALILSAAIELVRMSEFSVIFSGPPSLPCSAVTAPALGDKLSPRGLSLLPFVAAADWGIAACWPGDTEDDEEDALEGAFPPEWCDIGGGGPCCCCCCWWFWCCCSIAWGDGGWPCIGWPTIEEGCPFMVEGESRSVPGGPIWDEFWWLKRIPCWLIMAKLDGVKLSWGAK